MPLNNYQLIEKLIGTKIVNQRYWVPSNQVEKVPQIVERSVLRIAENKVSLKGLYKIKRVTRHDKCKRMTLYKRYLKYHNDKVNKKALIVKCLTWLKTRLQPNYRYNQVLNYESSIRNKHEINIRIRSMRKVKQVFGMKMRRNVPRLRNSPQWMRVKSSQMGVAI